jgi:hypothetical protein
MRARVGVSTLHRSMLDRNVVAGHGCCRRAGPSARPGPARKSARAGPGCSAAAQRSPFCTSHLLPVQEWVRKGSGAREPLCWISPQQAADKINSAEDDRVRAGRPGTAKVLEPKVLLGRVGHSCFLHLFTRLWGCVSR